MVDKRTVEDIVKTIVETTNGRWVELETIEDGLSVEKIGQTAIGVFFEHELTKRASEGDSYEPVKFYALESRSNEGIAYPVMLCAARGAGQNTVVTGFQNRSPYPQYKGDILALGKAIGFEFKLGLYNYTNPPVGYDEPAGPQP